jgi:DNA-binding NtrC family response regulator
MFSANSARNILVLQSTGSAVELCAPLAARGWNVIRRSDPKSLVSVSRNLEHAVGIAVIETGSTFNPCDLAKLVASDSSEWIAVISRNIAADHDVGRVVANGFCDFHTLPVDLKRLEIVMGHAIGRRALRRRFAHPDVGDLGSYGMVGRSPAMRALYRSIEKVVRVDAPLLLLGEPGTGKTLLARSLHDHSERRQGPFISVHCGTLPPGRAEAELFGEEGNAFSGASRYKAGRIERANGGTLFLEDIGSLPSEAQGRLLRFLRERTVVPVGGAQSLRVDARVIAAATKDLAQGVERGHFDADLFNRLTRLQLKLPPLRERRGDAVLLADYLFEINGAHRAANVRDFSSAAREAIEAHTWPGNVAELARRVTKAMIACGGRLITPSDLELAHRETDAATASLEEARLSADRDLIVAALERNGHNMAQTARQLGISRVTLYRLINKLRITRGKVRRPRGAIRGRGPWIFSKKAYSLPLPVTKETEGSAGRKSTRGANATGESGLHLEGERLVAGAKALRALKRGLVEPKADALAEGAPPTVVPHG